MKTTISNIKSYPTAVKSKTTFPSSVPLSRTGYSAIPMTDEKVNSFASIFCPYYLQNYGVQYDHESHRWCYKHKNPSTLLIKGFFSGDYWIAVPPTWYVRQAFIDIDNPLTTPDESVRKALNFSDSELLTMSSPGYKKEGRTHQMFFPRYKGNFMTLKLLQDSLGPSVKSIGAELFPRGRRLFRVPCGLNQHILDENGNPLRLSPEEFMYYCDKIDPYEITDKITHQTSFLPELYDNTTDPYADRIVFSHDARLLEKHGLQGSPGRHDACLTLARFYIRNNITPDNAIRIIRRWLRKKHNGYSKEINAGRWWKVDNEIVDIVSWAYENCPPSFLPDSLHNLQSGLVTPEDVRFSADVFRGDWINIKRTIALLQYCRPRKFFPWIYIPFNVWDKIASRDHYVEYKNTLSKKGIIINSRTDYSVGHYPKSFRIALPKSFSPPITYDGRAATDLKSLLLNTYGSSLNAVAAMNINRKTAWRIFRRS
ncbi:hypothetical protein ES705_22577 [subsurface metagenome]